MTQEQYDAIIIGAGQAGMPLSAELAGAGWRVALIERDKYGGTCINRGCTPTKTMVASGRVAYLARRAAEYGVHVGEVSVNLAEVVQRKEKIVTEFRQGGQGRAEANENIDLIFGQASFTAAKVIEVALPDGSRRQLTAEHIFINTGGRPTNPNIPGLEGVPTLDSTSVMELTELPNHLIVVGGGYIGLEFGQMYRRFGSQVTVVQRGNQLMGRQEDPDVAEEVAKILQEDGIEILLNTNTKQVEQDANGQIHLTVETADGARPIVGSHLLMSVGRAPNTDDLNLSAAGIETDKRGFIVANNRLETTVPGVYALGDVKGGPTFTHISYDDYRIIKTNLLEGGSATLDNRLVPYTLFTDPQLGRIGLSETAAKEKGLNYKVAKIPMAWVARALEMDESRGLMKAIIDADTDQIIGVAILGIEGGEIMAMLQVAMVGQLPYTALRDMVFAHPTIAESMNTLFSTVE